MPKRAIISWTLRSPVLQAAIWAFRSPQFWSGARTLARKMSSTCRLSVPSSRILTGGMRTPSWWISESVRESEAGTAPPTSVLWMWPTEKATISPSWKIGFQMCMSGECVLTKPE